MFDENNVSYSDTTIYNSSTFTGNKIFSYKEGVIGTADAEVGIVLSYRTITNVGDITFNFNLLNELFEYLDNNDLYYKNTDVSFLQHYSNRTEYINANAWQKAPTDSKQPVIRKYVFDNSTSVFDIDVYDDSASLADLSVTVFLNNELKLKDIDYTVGTTVNNFASITFLSPALNSLYGQRLNLIRPKYHRMIMDIMKFNKNAERNPLNDDVSEFTLGEVIDHVSTIIEDLPKFTGLYPGSTNMRDLGDIDTYGKRFIKHSGPINLPLYHITNKDYNIISAIEYSRDEYSRFKRNFVEIASNLGFDGPVKLHVDKVLYELNKDKVKTQPFYFSDMLASGTPNRIEYNVLDVRTLYYALSNNFNLTTLSPESVLIYLNGTQLTHEVDYTFDNQGFVLIDSYQSVGDTIEIYEYETTDGSYVPPTPTKLGLYPAFVPEIFIDDTYQTPTKVVQGHDGSIIVAYEDYRDNLLIELEKRIYNNLKVKYDT